MVVVVPEAEAVPVATAAPVAEARPIMVLVLEEAEPAAWSEGVVEVPEII